jgi:hypothetical protein
MKRENGGDVGSWQRKASVASASDNESARQLNNAGMAKAKASAKYHRNRRKISENNPWRRSWRNQAMAA